MFYFLMKEKKNTLNIEKRLQIHNRGREIMRERERKVKIGRERERERERLRQGKRGREREKRPQGKIDR